MIEQDGAMSIQRKCALLCTAARPYRRSAGQQSTEGVELARAVADGLDSGGEVFSGRRRKPEIMAHRAQTIVHATLHETQPCTTRWSFPSTAKPSAVNDATIQRIWAAHGLQPRCIKAFKMPPSPPFVEKPTDIIGLHLNLTEAKAEVRRSDPTGQGSGVMRREGSDLGPRSHAVRCADEARPRSTMWYDDKRHGTTTLFAALNVMAGKVVGQCHLGRHRHSEEPLRFLRHLDRAFRLDLTLHVILDKFGTHKYDPARTRLACHPRIPRQTPTGARGST